MIKILIADDHTIVRQGLRQIIEGIPDMAVAGEASTCQEVIKKLSGKDYDLVLLDICFPGRNGLDVLKQLKCMNPDLPVLILSMYPEEQYAIRSLRAGASGYLTKETAAEELVTAIKRVAEGKKYITSTLAERLAFEVDLNANKPLHGRLSDREYQVMCLIASGKRVKDIAGMLSLSIKTISTHRARILRKMGMETNAQLTHYAIKNNLVT